VYLQHFLAVRSQLPADLHRAAHPAVFRPLHLLLACPVISDSAVKNTLQQVFAKIGVLPDEGVVREPDGACW